MRAFVDTNVLIRHLTGDPPAQARRTTRLLARADQLLLADLIVAEVVYVLESFYQLPPSEVARLVRAIVVDRRIVVVDPVLLLRAIELHDDERLNFADAYLVASADVSGVGAVVSFDRAMDRAGTVRRLSP